MKIVRIIARLNVGGPARHVAWLTAEMRGAGHDAVLVAGTVPEGEGDMGYFARQLGVEPVRIPEMSREISIRDAITIWKLYKLFCREQPDIVHTHTAKAGTVGRIAGTLYRWLTPSVLRGRPRRCRFVHTYHGHVFHSYYGRLKTGIFLNVERVLARVATDAIIVISAQQYREIHEEFKVGRAKQFSIVPLGLDLDAFTGGERRRSRLRRELRVADEDNLVGIVGRLTDVKDHELFLRAAAQYKETYGGKERRVCFVVIGDGHLRPELETEARRLGLAEEVRFLGLRDDPEFFYPALDVVALTSLNEGTPLTLIEAMANSRAVVATEVGGVRDIIGEAVAPATEHAGYLVCAHGVLVTRRSAESFAAALHHLVRDERLRETMGERGLEFVRRGYSKDRLLADITTLYENLLGEDALRTSLRPADRFTSEELVETAQSKGD